MILQCSAIGKGAIMNATFYARTSTSNRENRAEHRLLEHLKERLGPEALENGQMPTWSALRQASLAMSVECDAEDQSQIERLTKIIENKANQCFCAQTCAYEQPATYYLCDSLHVNH